MAGGGGSVWLLNPKGPKIEQILGVATPAEPRGEKELFFVQILGGGKLLEFVEKCR